MHGAFQDTSRTMTASRPLGEETSGVSDPGPQLLKRAKDGDQAAFSELVGRYRQLVFRFSFNVCRDKVKAEETLQDTFVNVYRKLDQFDGRSKFTTWLYSIVTNNCLMKRRRSLLNKATVSIEEITPKERHEDGPQIHTPQWRHTPLDEAMSKELRERLDRAILKLPTDYRLVFILRDVEEQSAAETAKIMKITIPAVKSRLRRARIFLRSELNEYMTQ